MKCPKCGFDSDRKFCPECGAKLELEQSEQITQAEPETAKSPEQPTAALPANPEKKSIDENCPYKKEPKITKETRSFLIVIGVIGLSILIAVFIVAFNTKPSVPSDYSSPTASGYKPQDYDSDYDSDSDSDYDYEDDNDENEEETSKKYTQVNTKTLINNYKKYDVKDITTTIKVTEIKNREYIYKTHNYNGFDTIRIKVVFTPNDPLNVGDYLTINGTCFTDVTHPESKYGEENNNLRITIYLDDWLQDNKSLFKPVGSNKKKSALEKLTKIYTDNNIELYFVGCENDFGDVEARFLVNNKTSKKLTFQADTVVLDGRSYNDILMSDDVSGNAKGIITAEIEDCSNTKPKSVGCNFHYFDEIINETIDVEFTARETKVK